MKQLLLFSLLLIIAIAANAQTRLTYQNHAFKTGDHHDFILAQSVDAGKDGANVVWDFSNLISSGKLTSYMITPMQTEGGLTSNGANLALVEDQNTFYFNVSSGGMKHMGTKSGNSSTQFAAPFEKLRFPFSFGDETKGSYAGTLTANNAELAITGDYLIEGDAWGTLILPNGVYNHTLRVKQTLTYTFNNGTPIREITYRWYTSSVRYPLLVIIKCINNGNETVARVAYYAHFEANKGKELPEGNLSNELSDVRLVVSPNPFVDKVNVSYMLSGNAKISFDLLDGSGILIAKLQLPTSKEPGSYTDPISLPQSMTAGVYYLKAMLGDRVLIKKLVKF